MFTLANTPKWDSPLVSCEADPHMWEWIKSKGAWSKDDPLMKGKLFCLDNLELMW